MLDKTGIRKALEIVSGICAILYRKCDCNACPFNSLCATYFLCESFQPKTCEKLTYPHELKEHADEYINKINQVLVDNGYYEQEEL